MGSCPIGVLLQMLDARLAARSLAVLRLAICGLLVHRSTFFVHADCMHCTMLTHACAWVEDGGLSAAAAGCPACSSQLCKLAACDLRPSGTSQNFFLRGLLIFRVRKK